MFETAIESAAEFTRPIHTISRNYGSEVVQAGAASLFFVNADGWAITCKHVIELLRVSKALESHRNAFLKEISDGGGPLAPRKLLRQLESKYQLSKNKAYELNTMLVECTDGAQVSLEWRVHPNVDLALIKFKDFQNLRCSKFPTFPDDSEAINPGNFLCRLGFPFPEFNNYKIDTSTNSLQWTTEGRTISPRFT